MRNGLVLQNAAALSLKRVAINTKTQIYEINAKFLTSFLLEVRRRMLLISVRK